MIKFGKYDIIFNTIPSIILNEERLKLLKKEAIIIDLASKPGGVDFQRAKELGIKASLELGLPGRVAPITSAEYIYNVALGTVPNRQNVDFGTHLEIKER